MNDKLLTIGIPTFNRATKLLRLLDLLEKEFPNDVFFNIRDNHSDDNTYNLAKSWRSAKGRQFFVHRNSENIGIDRNIQAVILDAKTEWILLFSDDDEIVEGSSLSWLKNLREFEEKNIGLVYFNYSEYDLEKNILRKEKMIPLNDNKTYFPGYSIIQDLGECLPLISSLLINVKTIRNYVFQIPSNVKNNGVGFVWAILKGLENKSSLFWSNPLIKWNCTDPERGFSWKNTVVKDMIYIINDICPQYINSYLDRTIKTQLLNRARIIAKNNNSIMDKFHFINSTLPYYWWKRDYIFSVLPRLLAPKIIYRAVRKLLI